MVRKENFERFKSILKAGFNTAGNARLRQFGRGCDGSERETRCQIQQENKKSMGSSIRLLPRPDWRRDRLTMFKRSLNLSHENLTASAVYPGPDSRTVLWMEKIGTAGSTGSVSSSSPT
jgi:hypothetical protein